MSTTAVAGIYYKTNWPLSSILAGTSTPPTIALSIVDYIEVWLLWSITMSSPKGISNCPVLLLYPTNLYVCFTSSFSDSSFFIGISLTKFYVLTFSLYELSPVETTSTV